MLHPGLFGVEWSEVGSCSGWEVGDSIVILPCSPVLTPATVALN